MKNSTCLIMAMILVLSGYFILFVSLLTGILMVIMLIRATGPFTFLGVIFAWIGLLVGSSLFPYQKTAVFNGHYTIEHECPGQPCGNP